MPWTEIEEVRRARSNGRWWIGISLKTRRSDLDEISRRIRAMLEAMGSPLADADYVIRESDLPRSGLWLLDECHRRMAR